jgi:hypothetical protein
MAVSCWSSANDRAKGTPKKRAEVVMTQALLPPNDRTLQAELETALTRLEIQPRVVGGTISFSAIRRSVSDSFCASKSESFEISESADWKWRLVYLHECEIYNQVAASTELQRTSVGVVIIILNLLAGVVVLEVFVFDLGKGNHCAG